ncbi:MAG TPA: farnesyl diphosphate synthase [Candidatus Xenobia bacterium]
MTSVTQDELSAYMARHTDVVDAALEAFFPPDAAYLGRLGEMMRYALFPGGKRFRPILVIAAAEALGVPAARVLPTACAVEAIHGFSLVHDDLPSMDNDMVRRGKPTVHVKFGEAEALLVGDALSIYAFKMAAANGRQPGVDPAVVLQVIEELADASGYPGMVGGQIVDIRLMKEKQVSGEALLEVHRHKTGALIRGCVRAGAMLAGATLDQLRALTCYGENIGLVFQIIDDVLDAQEKAESVSFPAVFGLERSQRMAQEATMEAVAALESFDEKAAPLRKLAMYLLERDK